MAPLGYDPVGLNENLAIANGLIDANLLQGDYVALHTYGWTQFNIDADTQKLTVTTYDIPYHTEADLLANPSAITNLTPEVFSQFEVLPTLTANQSGAVGMGFGRSLLASVNEDPFNANVLAAIGAPNPFQ